MPIRSFAAADVPPAARLLAGRHRRDRVAEPLLGRAYEDPQVCDVLLRGALDRGAEGAVAVEGDRHMGYLLAVRGDDLRGRHVWSGPEHHALAAGTSPEIVRHLYAHLGQGWVDDGRLHHYAVVPPADLDSWLALAFGHEQVHAIRETAGAVGVADSLPFRLRRATPADVDAVVPVTRLIADANVESPVFAYVDPAFYDELPDSIRETIDDESVAFWIAEDAGTVLGFAAMRSVPEDESSLLKPVGTAELIVAATLRRARGTGVGRALCERAIAAAAADGHEVCVADWRAANLTASVFWPRRGFRPTAYRLHRLIDSRVVR